MANAPTIIVNARGETLRVIQPRETRRPIGFQPPKPKGGTR